MQSVQLDKSMKSDGELEFTSYVPFKGFETLTTTEFLDQIKSLKKQQKVNLMKSNFRLKLIGPSQINTNGLSEEQIKFINEALSETRSSVSTFKGEKDLSESEASEERNKNKMKHKQRKFTADNEP